MCLVGGFNPSGKYDSVRNILPNIWKNQNACSKPQSRSISYSESSDMII